MVTAVPELTYGIFYVKRQKMMMMMRRRRRRKKKNLTRAEWYAVSSGKERVVFRTFLEGQACWLAVGREAAELYPTIPAYPK